jgi:hypothetical protein
VWHVWFQSKFPPSAFFNRFTSPFRATTFATVLEPSDAHLHEAFLRVPQHALHQVDHEPHEERQEPTCDDTAWYQQEGCSEYC